MSAVLSNKDATTSQKSSGTSEKSSGTTDATMKKYKKALDALYAVMGLCMAVSKIKSIGFSVSIESDGKDATIRVGFPDMVVDIDSGTVNGKPLDATINSMEGVLRTLEKKEVANE